MKPQNEQNLNIKRQKLTEMESDRLWSGIYQAITTQPQEQSFNILTLVWQKRIYAAIAVLLIFVTTGISGTVALAQKSKPGDFLYPVELAYENVRMQLTFNPQDKSRLVLNYSQKRLQEVNEVLSQNQVELPLPQNTNNPTSTPAVEPQAKNKSLENIKKNHDAIIGALNYLENTQAELKKSGDGQSLQKVDSLVNTLSNQTEDYLKNLAEIKQEIPDNTVKEAIDHSAKELQNKFNLDKNQRQNNNQNDSSLNNKNNGRGNNDD